jgi:hypothetical protein
MKLLDMVRDAISSLPQISMYQGQDGRLYAEDPNLKDILHFADIIKNNCSLDMKDYSIPKIDVVDIVETVESELLSKEVKQAVWRDNLIRDTHAVRVKDENQLCQEFTNLGNSIKKSYPHLGSFE